MPLNRWQQIEEIFQAALDLPPLERLSYVSAQCPDDPELKREIEKLLSDYDEAENFIESPVWTDSHFLNSTAKRKIASSLEEAAPNSAGFEGGGAGGDRMIGRRIGVFELTKEIGRGGMGAVYLAERADGEFKQKVAVKLIKRGMDTDFIIRRFRHERQILANLDHPNIARLLDGGTTDDGLPYFVMEFIEGEPLYKYCDKNKLSVRKRLQIFQQVCSAVYAAHQRQVIHRDIKPGNILVTSFGTPKLLDFGIAKILDPDLIHESINPTSTMMRLMTLDYASPEQICGSEITPASDVYSLGVLLYELLTGHSPYRFTRGRSPHEVSRVICEVTPELPSRAVEEPGTLLPVYQTNRVSAEEAAELRGTTVEGLKQELADALDRLVMKALSKSPEERFASVKEFSADVSRFLGGEPVLAEPHFEADGVADHEDTDTEAVPAPADDKSIAVLPFKLLNISSKDATDDKFLGIGLADALITRLSNIQRFIVRPTSSVLRFGEKHFDPFAAGRELGVEFILDGHIQKVGKRIRVSVQFLNVADQTTIWAERFDENFTDVLNLEDVISVKVAEALIPHLTAGDRQNLAKRGTDNPQAFESYLRGRFHWNTFTEEGFAKAIVAYHEAIAHDPGYALAYAGIADYYNWLGVFGILPAHECFQSALESARRAIELDRGLSEAHAALGFAAVGGLYDWEQGEASCRRALELNPNNSTAHVWYSIQLFMEGRFNEGLEHARRGIELDPLSPFNLHNLGWGFYFARRFDESIAQYKQLIVKTNSQYPLAFYGLSWGLRMTGKDDEAVEAVRQALESDPDSTFVLSGYAQTLAAAGRRREAEEVLAQLRKISEKRPVSAYHVAVVYAFLKEKESALGELEKAFANHDGWICWMGVEPVFDFLRDDARFMALLEATGNPLFHREKTIVMERPLETATADKILTRDANAEEVKKGRRAAAAAAAGGGTLFGFPRWAVAACGLLVALLGVAALSGKYGWQKGWQQSVQTAATGSDDKSTLGAPAKSSVAGAATSIAVLPFKTVDAQTDDEQYLGVGTADLVTSKLGQISEINVRSASSVRRYLNTEKPATDIGRELAVDYVITGAIRRRDNNVEAELKMTETESGRVVWSQIFDEPNNNLFTLQDSISEMIAKSLRLRLTSTEKQNLAKHFTESDRAQQLYLAGRYHFGKRTVEGLRQAISLFQQAIQTDSNFALAYTGLADCYGLLNWYQEPPPPDAWENSRQAAQKAVQLDSDLAEAHSSLAFVKFHYERDYNGSEDEFRRAINLKPNYATAHQWYAFLLSAQGRHNEAIAVMRRAEELEPRSAVIANAVANVLYYARMHDESIAQVKRSLEIDPASVGAHVILRWNYEMKNAEQEAMTVYEKEAAFAGDTPTTKAKKAHVLAAFGKKEEARQILDELIRSDRVGHITPYEIAVIYSLLDDRQKSLEWLRKARDQHAVGFSFVKVDPVLDNVRKDKRFESLVQ